MSEAQKQRPHELLCMLWFDEKSISKRQLLASHFAHFWLLALCVIVVLTDWEEHLYRTVSDVREDWLLLCGSTTLGYLCGCALTISDENARSKDNSISKPTWNLNFSVENNYIFPPNFELLDYHSACKMEMINFEITEIW